MLEYGRLGTIQSRQTLAGRGNIDANPKYQI